MSETSSVTGASPGRGTPRFRRVALILCSALDLWFLHFAWISARRDSSQWQVSYFENCGGQPGLVHGGTGHESNPPIDVDRDGHVGLAPGESIVLPFGSSADYRVTSTTGALAPYFVLGFDGAPPVGAPADSRGDPMACVQEPLALEAGSALHWAPWRSSVPWHEDADRLRAVAAGCGATGDSVSAHIRRDGDVVTLELGTCSITRTLQPAESKVAAFAVIAGGYPVLVDRAGGWKVFHRIEWKALIVVALIALLHASLCLGGFGAFTTPLLLAIIAGLSVGLPFLRGFGQLVVLFPLLLVWLTLAVVGAFAAMWRGSGPLRASRGGVVGALGLQVVGVIAVVLLLGRIQTVVRGLIGGAPVVNTTPEPARCLLTGYSVPAGFSIAPWAMDVRTKLSETCGLCAGSTARYAMPGRVFEDVRDVLHRPEGLNLAPGGTVLFWGSVGDDLFWPLLSRRRPGSSLVMMAYAVQATLHNINSGDREHSTITEVMQLLDTQTENAVATWDEQRDVMVDALDTMRARGQHFGYFHGFLASEVAVGRTPARRWLLERRREVVETHGAVFVDLLAAVAPQVGVSWFNDLIHESTFGHQPVAAVMCSAMSGDKRAHE